jgi:hypothetical protein
MTEIPRAQAERIVSAIFACRAEDCPQPFALYRHQDVTGVSGTGTVAHGVQFADGQVVIRWLGTSPSTVVWNSLGDAMRVHGHDGKTHVVWLAAEFSEMAKAEEGAAAAERERIRQLATSVAAEYADIDPCKCGRIHCRGVIKDAHAPFADLLTDPEGTTT